MRRHDLPALSLSERVPLPAAIPAGRPFPAGSCVCLDFFRKMVRKMAAPALVN